MHRILARFQFQRRLPYISFLLLDGILAAASTIIYLRLLELRPFEHWPDGLCHSQLFCLTGTLAVGAVSPERGMVRTPSCVHRCFSMRVRRTVAALLHSEEV